MVCDDDVDALDELLVLWLAELDEYEVADCVISLSSADVEDAVFVVPDTVDAAVAVVLGAWAANHAPRPRKDAALTAPVMRRAYGARRIAP